MKLTDKEKTIMIGVLTNEDRKLNTKELKLGISPNIYRLGHYMIAADKCRLKQDIAEYFTENLAAKILKQIDSGKYPTK